MRKILKIKLKKADNFYSRLLGFSFKKNKINYCLLFNNCNGIHTFFMFQNIDVVMTDENNKVIYMKNNLKPLRIILPKKDCRKTFELPINTIKNYDINIGDVLVFEPFN